MDSDRYKIKKNYNEVYGNNEVPIIVKNVKIVEDYYTNKYLFKLEIQNINLDKILNLRIFVEFIDNQNVVKNSFEKEISNLALTLNQNIECEMNINVDESDTVRFTVKEICFENKNKINDVVLEKMDLDCALSTFDGLEEQYKREVKKLSSKCGLITNRYVENDNIWKCVCGNIYFKNVDECPKCKIKRENFIKIQDKDFLKTEFENFNKQKQENIEHSKIVLKKSISGIVIIIFLILVILFIQSYIKQNNVYKDANKLMENGKYSDAINLFEEIKKFKDSKEKLEQCKSKYNSEKCKGTYEEAKKAMDEKNYSRAKYLLEDITDYEDSKELIEKCKYEIELSTVLRYFIDYNEKGSLKEYKEYFNSNLDKYSNLSKDELVNLINKNYLEIDFSSQRRTVYNYLIIDDMNYGKKQIGTYKYGTMNYNSTKLDISPSKMLIGSDDLLYIYELNYAQGNGYRAYQMKKIKDGYYLMCAESGPSEYQNPTRILIEYSDSQKNVYDY